MTDLRDQLDRTVGHHVGWDVYDCPTCGPVPPGHEQEHQACEDQYWMDVGKDAFDLDYLGTATSAVSERVELDRLAPEPQYEPEPTL